MTVFGPCKVPTYLISQLAKRNSEYQGKKLKYKYRFLFCIPNLDKTDKKAVHRLLCGTTEDQEITSLNLNMPYPPVGVHALWVAITLWPVNHWPSVSSCI